MRHDSTIYVEPIELKWPHDLYPLLSLQLSRLSSVFEKTISVSVVAEQKYTCFASRNDARTLTISVTHNVQRYHDVEHE